MTGAKPPSILVVVEPVGVNEPLLAEDTRVGEFRIRGLLGEGAMGQVYLAQDTTLGRRVALKLIKRSAMQGDALARFLEEARATASFAHPHIVTLHAVGEHEGRPFLALEYLDGESLRARLAAGPLPVRDALRHARAVAEAIAEAHRRGLVHADLKPENIVIPRDGRVRVVDFGLAKLAGEAPNSASGTPAYMAPERWRGASPAGAIDIWALGVTLHELITGRRPISDAALAQLAFSTKGPELGELPASPWAPLVRDCLALDPAARPTAEDVVRRLTALIDPHAAAAASGDAPRCPFPGLAAFSRDDAADYFGRRAELDALVEQLRTRPLIPIVGPSGIGKSSFVRAALLPRLDETERWVAVALRPGANPFDQLAAALAVPGGPAPDGAALRAHPDRLSLLLGDLARHRAARVLLFLDQFEEAFTLAANDADAIALCDGLARAAASHGDPWRIVLALRDDFLGRLAASPPMRPHLGAVLPLAPLAAADLRAAIAGPLANASYDADAPDLVARIVADVEGQPACLPLLQFACRSLWERRDPAARQILAAEYDAMGGATGALASHAQRLLAELTADEVRLARAILLALVHPDGTRRPRLRAELLDGLPDDSATSAGLVLDRLLERRLVVATRDAERDAPMLEVAHEALATAWPQLARWLDETFEQRVLVTELEQASALWHRRGRRDDETWGGVALAEAARKVEQWHIALPSLSRAFLDASERRAHSLRRRRRWLISTIIGVLAAAAVAAALTAVAFARKEDEALESQRRLRESQAEMQLAAADMGEVLLELEPFDWDPDAQEPRTPADRPPLAWRLRAVDAADRTLPGRLYAEPTDLRRGTPGWRGPTRAERIDVRSGPAFLEIDGRGGDCPPSVLALRRLPGYAERGAPRVVHVRVPTCAASRAGMIDIPAGEFLLSEAPVGAPGPTDRPVHVGAYAIDRTEVTFGAFDVYDAMRELTDDGAAPSSHLGLDPDRRRSLPVVGVNFFTARNYCRYLGKDLPSVEQWQKAYRGGLTVRGAPNPRPDRITPWLRATSPHPTNLEAPGSELAPVGSFPDDTSPYGVVDLAGNVSEWSLARANAPQIGLRTVLGASWNSPPALDHHDVTWRNSRPDVYLDYTIGVRCVAATR